MANGEAGLGGGETGGSRKAPWAVSSRSGEWTLTLSRWLRDLGPWAGMLAVLAGAIVILAEGVQASMSKIATYVRQQDPDKE